MASGTMKNSVFKFYTSFTSGTGLNVDLPSEFDELIITATTNGAILSWHLCKAELVAAPTDLFSTGYYNNTADYMTGILNCSLTKITRASIAFKGASATATIKVYYK